LVVFEKADGNYSAFSPDLPGGIATGANRKEVEHNIKEAVSLHMEGMKEDGIPLPDQNRLPGISMYKIDTEIVFQGDSYDF
jgi:predicted RNase H-like HicB family nuclease